MPGYKSFAVAGAGNIGLPIVRALAAQNVSVVVLSRPESATKEFPPGVQIAKVDLNDVAAISAVLKEHKVDVVLSTVPTPAAGAQRPLVDAAKLAKVKLFVPSEYGMPSDGHSESVQGEKNKLVGKFCLVSLAPQL
jgi:saccharopine dehydrogenase-like NADP-dependent oxidoreductase